MKTIKLTILLLTLSLAHSAYGAVEMGEYCFSGAFFKEGDCHISLDVTQHTKYYSLNGVVDCQVKTNDDGISGIASGSGYIEGGLFIGSLIIPHPWGQIGVRFSEIAAHGMTFEVNLSDLSAVFRKETTSPDVCEGSLFLAICIEEAAFTLTECP